MSWWNPFGKKTEEVEKKKPATPPITPATAPELGKALAETPEGKGVMAAFYRKWKDPAFMKQLRTLAAHMQKEGVDIKDQAAVKAWIEKNKDAIEKGRFSEPPADGAAHHVPFEKKGPDVGRNEPCPCGSGKKYKKCCDAAAPRS